MQFNTVPPGIRTVPAGLVNQFNIGVRLSNLYTFPVIRSPVAAAGRAVADRFQKIGFPLGIGPHKDIYTGYKLYVQRLVIPEILQYNLLYDQNSTS